MSVNQFSTLHGLRLTVFKNLESFRALQVEAEEAAAGGLLFAEGAGDVEPIHARAAEGDVARRQVAARIAADDFARGADDLHLPHAVVRDEEVALLVETHAVGFARDLPVAFRGEF